jgi:hypothetical protein
LSFETRKQDAEKVLRRWRRSNQSEAAQKRLINDGERAWMLARDLAEALDNLLGHARNVQHGYLAVARRRWRASPEETRRIADHAKQSKACDDCQAAPGEPCIQAGKGRSVHKPRYIAAAIDIRRQARAAQRTPEQAAELAAILAGLPRLTREEVEAGRFPAGGFTCVQLAAWRVPWPPPSGWLHSLLRGEDGSDDS